MPAFLAALVAIAPLAGQATTPQPPTPSQPTPAPQPGAPPPEFMVAAQALGSCLQAEAGKVPPTATPEAGSHQAVMACATQKSALNTSFETWITGPGFPEAGREPARAQLKRQMDGLEAQVAAGLRQSRAATPPVPTPGSTPTPSASPKP